MEGPYEDYLVFLEKLGNILEQLTEVEKEKTMAVRRDDLDGVEACMKREQVISLQLRSMDAKREKMLSALGMKGVPLSGFAARCPESVRLRARDVAEQVRAKYDVYRSAAELARTTLEINLHEIEKLVKSQGAEPLPDAPAANIWA